VLLLAVVLAVALAGYWFVTAPDVASLARENPKTTAFIERYRSRARADGGKAVAWTWVPYARISPHLKRAVVASEDLGFFSHHGFDLPEVRIALEDAWRERRFPRGASTISQQTAKNLWLSPSPNPVRKIREAFLTRSLEKHLGKRRILEIYLNVVEFAPGVYGAEAASRRFFGKSAAELDPEEAARLAAGLPRPSRWHPGSASRTYERRVRRLLARMEQAQYLWKQI
jgi:monofunctional biosynthetic peptidoglycan transglycosylase